MKIVPSKILIIMVLISVSAFAGPVGPPPPGIPPPGLPIDSGVLLLFIAAIGYGFYKIYQQKLNKKTPM
jgi:hypothetical protein